MKKFCVFCGNPPENKNMEHVIPQWLSKYTERFNEECHQKTVTDAKIRFRNLKFPACTKCNDAFGKLESATKPILLSIMEGKPVSGEQINILLDWFDKIRVGIWLSELILAKKVDEINPGFHIADRMGQKDRLLMVERVEGNPKGLAYAGTGTELFYNTPTAIQLIVNDFIFTNASEHGLVSARMGFPCRQKMPIRDGFQPIEVEVMPGRNKTSHPVVMSQGATPFKTLIYQPIYRNCCNIPPEENPYNCEYVRNHSYDPDNGVGGIFFQRTNNQIHYLDAHETVNLTPKAQPKKNFDTIIRNVFKLQNYMMENLYTMKDTDPKLAQYIQKQILLNKIYAGEKLR